MHERVEVAHAAEVAEVVADLELGAVTSSFIGAFGELGKPQELVEQAWNLSEVEAAYLAFLDEFDDAEARQFRTLDSRVATKVVYTLRF